MGLNLTSNVSAQEEAAQWVQRLRLDDSAQTRSAFDAWLRKGADNLQEFLFAQALWEEMDHLDGAAARRFASEDIDSTVVDLPPSQLDVRDPRAPRSRMSAWRIAAAMIPAALLTAWALAWVVDLRSNVHTTQLGEQRTVKLDDGSVVYLNTGSRIEARMTETERVVRLIAGEALFSVSRDPQRPFSVLTDSASVRVLGTQFNVYRNNNETTRVAVVEGAVQVSSTTASTPLRLNAGDAADVGAARVTKLDKPDIGRALSWRTRILVFPGDRVDDIAAQFNRYNKTQIRIEGEIREHRMSGVFDADDPSPLIRYLQNYPRIEVLQGEDEILIRPRPGS